MHLNKKRAPPPPTRKKFQNIFLKKIEILKFATAYSVPSAGGRWGRGQFGHEPSSILLVSKRIPRGSGRVLITTWVQTEYCWAHSRIAPSLAGARPTKGNYFQWRENTFFIECFWILHSSASPRSFLASVWTPCFLSFLFVKMQVNLPLLLSIAVHILVVERRNKFFRLQIRTWLDSVSVDRLKPVISDSPVTDATSALRGRASASLHLQETTRTFLRREVSISTKLS